jgi:hypothetical protein
MGREMRGLYKAVPRERFDAAVARFDRSFEVDGEAACRRLFYDVLWPIAEEQGKRGLVEMTTDNVIQGETLSRLFPEGSFILTVRDGRDAGASKVSRRQRSHHPTEAFGGVDWWLERMLRVERGLRAIEPERVYVIGLDTFIGEAREEMYAGLLAFLQIKDRALMRHFFDTEMSPEGAHRGRWREGLSPTEQDRLSSHYERAIERLETEGSRSAPLLRRAFELDR